MVGQAQAPAAGAENADENASEQNPAKATVTEQASEKVGNTIETVVEKVSKKDLEAITEALEKAHDELADEAADKKHTGVRVDEGCRGCAREYRLNGQTQSDFAGPSAEATVETAEEEVQGGPLDQLAVCNVI